MLDSAKFRLLKCAFDGQDYVHTWRGGALVWHEPTRESFNITTGDLELFFFRNVPQLGDKCVIAGAGAGTELQAYADSVGPSGFVLCLEPDPVAFRRLTKLITELGLTNTKALNLAVADKKGFMALSQTDQTAVTHTVMGEDTNAEVLQVEVDTLDAICHAEGISHIDHLKMNIEGAEYLALQGLHKVSVSHVCVSCHDFMGQRFETMTNVVSLLEGKGMKTEKHPDDPNRPWVGSYIYACQ